MSKRTGFNIIVALTVIGAVGGVVSALSSYAANEELTAGAPQQTVVALWAVRDLLVILVGVGVALVMAVAWNGLAKQD